MAMTIRPTDGLVHRLLQQQTRQNNDAAPKGGVKAGVEDTVNISKQARQEHAVSPPKDQPYGYQQRDLESQLLKLYTHHDTAPDSPEKK